MRCICPKCKSENIMKHKQLYDIGLHGPDILFYYHPLVANPLNEIGYVISMDSSATALVCFLVKSLDFTRVSEFGHMNLYPICAKLMYEKSCDITEKR